MQEKLNDIKYIQNTVVIIFKNYLPNRDMAEYNQKSAELVQKYRAKGDKLLLEFCRDELMAYAKVVNAFADECRKESSDD